MRTHQTGLVLAIASAATFSTSGSFAHSLIDAGWTPGAAVAARISVAAVVIAIPALVAMRGRWATLRRNGRPHTWTSTRSLQSPPWTRRS